MNVSEWLKHHVYARSIKALQKLKLIYMKENISIVLQEHNDSW